MITFKLLPDGGFVAGDTDTGRASYAYPTSSHATIARTMPARIAAEMMESANRYAASCPAHILNDYHSRLWDMLYQR
jgi:hypothetical protein